MDVLELNEFINVLTSSFEILYNQYFGMKETHEDANILWNGYCLYYACFLQELLPEGNVVATGNYHYIFEYRGNYYDGRGYLQCANGILIFPDGTYEPQKKLSTVIPEEEFAYRDILGMSDKHRDFVWEKIKPELLKIGKDYLNQMSETETPTPRL